MSEKVVKQGIGIVGMILSAFGGFLLNIAPPKDAAAGFPVGIASLILLVSFLFIRFSPQFRWARKKYLKVWTIVAVVAFAGFLASSIAYYLNFQNLVYQHTDNALFVKGSKQTSYAKDLTDDIREREGEQVVTDQRLMSETGNPHNQGVIEQLWTAESVKAARFRLALLYVAVVVTVGCAILSLTALWSAPR